MAPFISTSKDGVIIKILVQPRSSRNKVAGVQEDHLKLKLTAPPVEDAANQMCQSYLAGLLGVPRRKVQIISGHKSRRKRFSVEGLTQEEVRRKLLPD
jgi:uncharacterized protein (TIGR00251 family)